MLTIEGLKNLGADVESGLQRCMNNEAFYLKMVEKSIKDNTFETLKEAIDAGDLDRAFEAAHAMKGVVGNLSLMQVYEPVSEITELLRSRMQTDYSAYLERIKEKKEELVKMAES